LVDKNTFQRRLSIQNRLKLNIFLLLIF